MKLIIITEVTDEKELSDWWAREGILTQEEKTELVEKGKIELHRTKGSKTTYEFMESEDNRKV